MITIDELNLYKKRKNLDLGQTEKDYLLELALMALSKETKNNLVFKGGTCLYKFYGLDRFSEDLDFSVIGEINYDSLMEELKRKMLDFGIKAEIRSKREPFNSILTILRFQGPLYDGNPRTLSSIRIDINKKSEVILAPKLEIFHSIYRDILPFSVLCMQKEEVLAEKIRAIMTRDKSRDVYDAWFMIKQGVKINKDLIRKKLKYYGIGFSYRDFVAKLSKKKALWETELKHLVLIQLPTFNNVKGDILEVLK